MEPSIKLVCFSGAGRSGSTLFASLLGEIPGFVCIGEGTAYALKEGIRAKDIPCGCGSAVRDCEFWREIDASQPDLFEGEGGSMTRLRALPLLLMPWRPRRVNERIRALEDRAREFLMAVQRHTGAEVIVDASKNPAFIHLLSTIVEVELHVVHLLRDPRGFVSSRSRPKEYLARIPPMKAAMVWGARNLAAELTARRAASYRRVRYEDFVADPKTVLAEVARSVVGHPVEIDFIDGAEAELGVHHMLAGNPDKLGRTSVTIQAGRWHLTRWVSAMVTTLLLPLMLRYRYLRS